MIKVYGLDKCSTCLKARKWLEKHKIEHEFVDYREHRVDAPTLRHWAKASAAGKASSTAAA